MIYHEDELWLLLMGSHSMLVLRTVAQVFSGFSLGRKARRGA